MTRSPRAPTADRATRSAPARNLRAPSAETPSGAPRARGHGLTRRTDLQQQATSVPMLRAAAARQKTSAQDGSGVPCPLQFPQRPGVRDGQKHSPDFNTPAITGRYPGATNDREEPTLEARRNKDDKPTPKHQRGRVSTSAIRPDHCGTGCSLTCFPFSRSSHASPIRKAHRIRRLQRAAVPAIPAICRKPRRSPDQKRGHERQDLLSAGRVGEMA